MVLGEPQILGQMKQAVRLADRPARWAPRCTSCSSAASRWPRRCAALHRDRRAFSISMAAAAVRLASAALRGSAQDQGAVRRRRRDDRTGGHALRRAQGPKAIAHWPTARWSAAKAGQPLRRRRAALSDMPARLHEFDIVVSCTASTLPIIGLGAGRARVEGAQAPADVHGRPGRAARHRARGGAPVRRVPVHRG